MLWILSGSFEIQCELPMWALKWVMVLSNLNGLLDLMLTDAPRFWQCSFSFYSNFLRCASSDDFWAIYGWLAFRNPLFRSGVHDDPSPEFGKCDTDYPMAEGGDFSLMFSSTKAENLYSAFEDWIIPLAFSFHILLHVGLRGFRFSCIACALILFEEWGFNCVVCTFIIVWGQR